MNQEQIQPHVIGFERAKALQAVGIKFPSLYVWAGDTNPFVTTYAKTLAAKQVPAYMLTEMLNIINAPVRMEILGTGNCIAGTVDTNSFGTNNLLSSVSMILLTMAKKGML